MKTILLLIKRDLFLSFKKGSGTGNIIAFFAISSLLFAFGVGYKPDLLKNIGYGVIWVSALLSSMIAIPQIFDEDFEDGSLALIFLQGHLLESIILAKIISHWIISCLPLIIIAPLISAWFDIEDNSLQIMLSLLVGTPTLCVIASLGSALTLGIKRVGNLIGIIVLPLYIPVLIFGANSNISILLALLLLMLPVGVFASSLAIKMALEN